MTIRPSPKEQGNERAEPSRRRARRFPLSNQSPSLLTEHSQHYHDYLLNSLPHRPPLQPPHPRLKPHTLGLNRPIQRMTIALEHKHLNLCFPIPLERMKPTPSLIGGHTTVGGAEEEESGEGYVLGVGEGGDGVQVGVG